MEILPVVKKFSKSRTDREIIVEDWDNPRIIFKGKSGHNISSLTSKIVAPNKDAYDQLHEITIKCNRKALDPLIILLSALHEMSVVGSTRSVMLKHTKKYIGGIDGDGSVRIKALSLNGIDSKKWKFKKGVPVLTPSLLTRK